MSASSKAALGVVGLVLMASNVYAYRHWTAERANSADLGKQLKEQTLALAKAQSARRTAEDAAAAAAIDARTALARLAAAGATPAAPAAPAPAARPKEPPAPPDNAAMRARMVEQMAEYRARLLTPEGRAAFKRQQAAQIRRSMPGLAEALGLDEQGLDRFLDVIAESNLRRMEQMDPNSPGSGFAAAANPRTEVTADIAAAFGSDVASRYQTYQDGTQGRNAVRGLLVGFAEADASLSKVQRQQLADTYTAAYKAQQAQRAQLASTGQSAGAAPQSPDRMLAGAQRNFETAQSTNNAVLAEAASYLSPSQLKVLQKQQQDSLDSQRMAVDMMRQRSATAGTGAAGGLGGGNMPFRP